MNNVEFKGYIITDRFNKQVVASKKTIKSASTWAHKLNDGLAMYEGLPRYSVSKA